MVAIQTLFQFIKEYGPIPFMKSLFSSSASYYSTNSETLSTNADSKFSLMVAALVVVLAVIFVAVPAYITYEENKISVKEDSEEA